MQNQFPPQTLSQTLYPNKVIELFDYEMCVAQFSINRTSWQNERKSKSADICMHTSHWKIQLIENVMFENSSKLNLFKTLPVNTCYVIFTERERERRRVKRGEFKLSALMHSKQKFDLSGLMISCLVL